MIDLYYWPTPNGHKITIFLEEAGLRYKLNSLNIKAGDQFTPDYIKVNPNSKMPAIVDHAPQGIKGSLSVFESGAILLYLAEKTQKFLPDTLTERYLVIEWLFWQVSGLGPMAGQNHHFSYYAAEKIPYAIERYLKETARLYGVLNKQLEGKSYIANEYSIADMACYPWIVMHERQGQALEDFPNVNQWFLRMQKRPAVQRAYEKAKSL